MIHPYRTLLYGLFVEPCRNAWLRIADKLRSLAHRLAFAHVMAPAVIPVVVDHIEPVRIRRR